jgi:hypothetical protein
VAGFSPLMVSAQFVALNDIAFTLFIWAGSAYSNPALVFGSSSVLQSYRPCKKLQGRFLYQVISVTKHGSP